MASVLWATGIPHIAKMTTDGLCPLAESNSGRANQVSCRLRLVSWGKIRRRVQVATAPPAQNPIISGVEMETVYLTLMEKVTARDNTRGSHGSSALSPSRHIILTYLASVLRSPRPAVRQSGRFTALPGLHLEVHH